jgi:hypothetical protein
MDFPDTESAPAADIGLFTDFTADAAAGTLAAYSWLEPSWTSAGNSQHPNYNVALGEQLLLDTYRAVRSGPAWAATLLIVTYDEHGGGGPPQAGHPAGLSRPPRDACTAGSGPQLGVRLGDREDHVLVQAGPPGPVDGGVIG